MRYSGVGPSIRRGEWGQHVGTAPGQIQRLCQGEQQQRAQPDPLEVTEALGEKGKQLYQSQRVAVPAAKQEVRGATRGELGPLALLSKRSLHLVEGSRQEEKKKDLRGIT